jgi:hypothetical protein
MNTGALGSLDSLLAQARANNSQSVPAPAGSSSSKNNNNGSEAPKSRRDLRARKRSAEKLKRLASSTMVSGSDSEDTKAAKAEAAAAKEQKKKDEEGERRRALGRQRAGGKKDPKTQDKRGGQGPAGRTSDEQDSSDKRQKSSTDSDQNNLPEPRVRQKKRRSGNVSRPKGKKTKLEKFASMLEEDSSASDSDQGRALSRKESQANKKIKAERQLWEYESTEARASRRGRLEKWEEEMAEKASDPASVQADQDAARSAVHAVQMLLASERSVLNFKEFRGFFKKDSGRYCTLQEALEDARKARHQAFDRVDLIKVTKIHGNACALHFDMLKNKVIQTYKLVQLYIILTIADWFLIPQQVFTMVFVDATLTRNFVNERYLKSNNKCKSTNILVILNIPSDPLLNRVSR